MSEQHRNFTHCGHDVAYIDDCPSCDRLWADQVTLPHVRELIAKLMRFYSVTDLRQLILEQDMHVEKLQEKLPPLRDDFPTSYRRG